MWYKLDIKTKTLKYRDEKDKHGPEQFMLCHKKIVISSLIMLDVSVISIIPYNRLSPGRCFRREVLSFGTFDPGMLFHWSAVEMNTTKWVPTIATWPARCDLKLKKKNKQTSFIRRHQCKRMIVFSLFSFYLDNFSSSLSAIISSWTSSQTKKVLQSKHTFEVFSWIWHASVLRQNHDLQSGQRLVKKCTNKTKGLWTRRLLFRIKFLSTEEKASNLL